MCTNLRALEMRSAGVLGGWVGVVGQEAEVVSANSGCTCMQLTTAHFLLVRTSCTSEPSDIIFTSALGGGALLHEHSTAPHCKDQARACVPM